MSAVPLTRPTLANLSVSLSRISIRNGHIRPRWKKPQPELSGHPPDHGEKIFIWDNVKTKQVVHSMFPVMDVYKAQKQLPFIAKKSKPAKIRKDTWRQLCIVEFPEGRGDVGQSVYQRLREFRRRHELEWDDDMFFGPNNDGTKKRVLSRRERGRKIHEQRDNAIADLAAVLAGAGRGTRVFKVNDEPEMTTEQREAESESESAERKLVPATIRWANSIDKNYAIEWSENVSHAMLPNGLVWELEDDNATAPTLADAKD